MAILKSKMGNRNDPYFDFKNKIPYSAIILKIDNKNYLNSNFS